MGCGKQVSGNVGALPILQVRVGRKFLDMYDLRRYIPFAMALTARTVVRLSPFLIIAVNLALAYLFGAWIGKWAFVPMILVGWALWLFFILRYGGMNGIRQWLQRPVPKKRWVVLCFLVGLLPLPLFLGYYDTLTEWHVWLPWIALALVNPWIEEFYWRGLLLDYTREWSHWASILYASGLFAANHLAFGVNSVISEGPEPIVATFIMGIVWSFTYYKTKSLRWAIFSHFLVDLLSLSAPVFLDLFEKGT